MPSPADAALCAREPALPGLAGVLDAAALAARAGLPPMRHAYLRYKPGTSCVAGLVPEQGLGAWAAMTYPAARYAEVRAHPAWSAGVHFLDAENTALVPLAQIRRPRAGRRLASAARRTALLSGLGLMGDGIELDLLRFKPGRRIVLRADAPDGSRAVLRLYADSTDHARAARGAAHAASLGGPAVLGIDAERGALATAWTPGRTLTAASDVGAFASAGAALAAAHAVAPTSALARWTPADPVLAAEAVAWLLPGLADRVRALVTRLPGWSDDAAATVHGDFSADQVIDGPGGLTIVDWDRAAAGPVARDLGSAVAALDLDALRGTPARAAAEALVAGYRAAGGDVADAAIEAHRAHALLALAVDGFRTRRPDWSDEMEAVLERLETLTGRRPRGTSSAPLSDALDMRIMRPPLARIVGGGADEMRSKLLRLKPGRRALIRYSRPGRSAVLGKLRFKAPDRTSPRVQAALRAAGLDGTKGVGVPAVLGRVDALHLWLQEEVAGIPLGALLDVPEGAAALCRTGRALAALHDTPARTEREWTYGDELAVLVRAVAGGPHAGLATLAETRLVTLAARATRTPVVPVGLHRDFYFDQVLVAPDVLWLVDLDLYSRGDAAVDIGNFLAHLTELGLRSFGDADRYAPLRAAFLDGYATVRPLLDPDRIDALHWISLARHVVIAERFPERRAAIPAIAALCRRRLAPGSPAQPDPARAAM